MKQEICVFIFTSTVNIILRERKGFAGLDTLNQPVGQLRDCDMHIQCRRKTPAREAHDMEDTCKHVRQKKKCLVSRNPTDPTFFGPT